VCADRLPGWIWVLLWSKDKPIGIMGIASKESRHYSSNDENSAGRDQPATGDHD